MGLKGAELKALVGKTVCWEVVIHPRLGLYRQYRGVVLEVKGRNVLMDRQGSHDWMHLDELPGLKPA